MLEHVSPCVYRLGRVKAG